MRLDEILSLTLCLHTRWPLCTLSISSAAARPRFDSVDAAQMAMI